MRIRILDERRTVLVDYDITGMHLIVDEFCFKNTEFVKMRVTTSGQPTQLEVINDGEVAGCGTVVSLRYAEKGTYLHFYPGNLCWYIGNVGAVHKLTSIGKVRA